MKPYPRGNGDHTVDFLKDLQTAYPNKDRRKDSFVNE